MVRNKCVPVEGGVAVDDGNRHGGAVCDWNLYGDSRRLMYRAGVLLEKLSTFRTITTLRGLSVTCVECGDFASKTSSQSYKVTLLCWPPLWPSCYCANCCVIQ